MTAIERSRTVAVVGAGTMGQGIAQVALLAGHRVLIYDINHALAADGVSFVQDRVERMAAKGRIDRTEAEDAIGRIDSTGALADLAGAALVIEAVVEDVTVKQALFAALEEVVSPDALLATNTSSLSVTELAAGLTHPGRFLGLHFFNPAPLLPLVEVVSGSATDPAAAELAYRTVLGWGKTPVRCADTPGFIVNRIARPFYAEAFAVYEERGADPATIDAVLRECGGFKMGPFALTDLIGQDVNEAVTRSVWESFFRSPKFTPSLAQRRLVQSGRLGRKSGHGWFPYGPDAQAPAPHTAGPEEAPAKVTVVGDLGPAAGLAELLEEAGIAVTATEHGGPYIQLPGEGQLVLADGKTSIEFADVVYFDLALDYRGATRIALSAGEDTSERTLAEAIGLFQKLGKKVSVIGDVPGMIVARTVAMLIDLTADAVARGVAAAEDIDTAMRLGVNYPLGPAEWHDRLGRDWAYDLLHHLDERCPGGRYAPSLALFRLGYAEGPEGAGDEGEETE
ncbi:MULTISPECIES: 3-hydroxyacyl-CoA dehydrogenase [unclassified Streptomyces]|uniref:3-hydroxyacyl-CoA dehydrogenase n=1 Tax=unclassified Streptomyces TaxID=2593676 RepID=UPI001BE6AEF8|nr:MULTISPECIES: 3-hydroxyacyl-CoA dehydrogenase [unclassified Streptomyces]MBT2404072.1 3-hydroxyacyl-CoA dehydrogenase [Streptomyces sp. ISL-21]MBT2454355.1 3-hydroxyacyl-CoA dehydrogenase [Streptomyces sp. ISL-86]MBT2607883.1 3-hydroxyacyl-CoA dehydrogenase [Streptomyces sp. ISL-87]